MERERSRKEFEELQLRDPAAAQAIIDNARKNESAIQRFFREQKEKELQTAEEFDDYIEARAKYGLQQRDFSQYMYEIPKNIDPKLLEKIEIPSIDEIEKSKTKETKLKEAQSFVSDNMFGGKFVLLNNEKDRPLITYTNFYSLPSEIDLSEFESLPHHDEYDNLPASQDHIVPH